MDDNSKNQSPESEQTEPQQRQFRGLYRYVRISVKTLDKIIAVGVIAIIAVIIFGVSHNGYTVEFDSNGGTDVASQQLKYGDLVEEPEDPSREGYTFEGWYTDENYAELYDFDTTTIYNDLTLYAQWEETE